jgi:hypothetical protein
MSDKIAYLEKRRNILKRRIVNFQATIVGCDKATVKAGEVEVVSHDVLEAKK